MICITCCKEIFSCGTGQIQCRECYQEKICKEVIMRQKKVWKDSNQSEENLKELIIADFGYYMIGIFLGVLGIAILSLLLYALFY